jgi:hypothetical protein
LKPLKNLSIRHSEAYNIGKQRKNLSGFEAGAGLPDFVVINDGHSPGYFEAEATGKCEAFL